MNQNNFVFQERLRSLLLLSIFVFIGISGSFFELCGAQGFPDFSPMNKQANGPAGDASFKLSDEELKKLNLGENETQEIKQFFEALNNLTPEQKRELEELGRQTEENMRKRNLDPSNFDDLVKFMEEEGLAPQQSPASLPAPTGPTSFTPFMPEKPRELLPDEKPLSLVVDAQNAADLLHDLSKYLNSFKHKAFLQNSYKNKIKTIHKELIEFSYYLEVLRQPDLVLLLGTSEFTTLYKNLEELRTALLTYEPSIKMASSSFDEDNPYEILDIPLTATPEEIQKTYETLAALYDPEVLAERLKEQEFDEKAIQKEVKKARLFFSFIKEAYTSLKDPKQKAFIDRNLRHKREQELRRTNLSAHSFDKIMNALMVAFRAHTVVPAIKLLIEKNKPQELAAARVEIEKEQKALERSKTPLKIAPPAPQPPVNPLAADNKYGEFYQKMAMESFNRPAYPMRYDWGPSHAHHQRSPHFAGAPSSAGAAADSSKKAAAGPQAGKKEDPKGKEATKKEGTKGKLKSQKKKEKKDFSKEEINRYLALQRIEQILREDTQLLASLEKPRKKESDEEEGEMIELPPVLPALMQSLEKDLISASSFKGPKDEHPVVRFIDLANRLKLSQLKKDFHTIVSPEKEKKETPMDDPDFKKDWQEKIAKPYGKTVLALYDIFYTTLDATERKRSKPSKLPIDHDKANRYNLIGRLSGPKATKNKEFNLGILKDDAASLMDDFDKIEQTLASSPDPKKKK